MAARRRVLTGRRRFLVVVRAGDASLHPAWVDPSHPRSFDLVVSYYGRDPERYRDAPFRRVDDPGQKFEGLKALLEREGFWRDYDWIWLPDDDLATEPAGIDRMFAMMEALSFDLAQPSLDWHSHYWWGITLRSPSFCVRCTDMVEIMAPCFSRGFLERCLPTFGANLSGWGLSFVWPHLLGRGLRRCGLLGDVTVTHPRAAGGPSDERLRAEGRDPAVERAELLARHGLRSDQPARLLGAIDATGRYLDPPRRDDGPLLAQAQLRDADAFLAERPRIEAASLGRRLAHAPVRHLPLARLREIAHRLPFGR